MGVQVDQSRYHDMAGDIPGLPATNKLGSEFRHFTVGECDIQPGVQALCGVNDPAALQYEIEHAHSLSPTLPQRLVWQKTAEGQAICQTTCSATPASPQRSGKGLQDRRHWRNRRL